MNDLRKAAERALEARAGVGGVKKYMKGVAALKKTT
jgi:hypothetical protein